MHAVDGREGIRVLRKHSSMAIIALSSRDRESEMIATLDLGVDDFVCKSIKLGELMVRVRAALRTRFGFEPVAATHHAGHLTIDAATRTVATPIAAAHVEGIRNPAHFSNR
jgi:two-component system KDP operon response regulator KdpE